MPVAAVLDFSAGRNRKIDWCNLGAEAQEEGLRRRW